MRNVTKRVGTALGALAVSAAAFTTGAVPAQSAVAAGSAASAVPPGALAGIRTGAHPGFDRIVLDFPGGAPDIVGSRFVPELIRDGSGEVEPMPGAAFAEVTMFSAGTADGAGRSTYPGPRKFTTPGLNNVTGVAITGDYEGYLTLGTGLRRQTSLHVFTLTGPPRIVVDIAR